MSLNGPIGVLDSGLGGLRLLAAAAPRMPGRDFLYYGDLANAPYGEKSAAEVTRLARAGCLWLTRQGAIALALACNTATSVAAAPLRAELPLPVVGMEPALKPAAAAHPGGRILVMATPLTLREEKFRALMERLGDGRRIDLLPCPGLSAAIDRFELERAGQRAVELLAGFEGARRADAVVLGCTHYGFIAPAIRQWFGPDCPPFYDGIEGAARRLREVAGADPAAGAEDARPLRARVRLRLTGADAAYQARVWELLESLESPSPPQP